MIPLLISIITALPFILFVAGGWQATIFFWVRLFPESVQPVWGFSVEGIIYIFAIVWPLLVALKIYDWFFGRYG